MRPIDFFDAGYDMAPDAVCLIDDEAGRELSYAEVRELTLKAGNGIRAAGLAPGARAAVLSINDPIAFVAALSFFRAGLVWVPIHPGNGLEDNIHALGDFGCEVLFYHGGFEAQVAEICRALPAIRLVVRIDGPGADAPAFDDWVRDFPADEIDAPDEPGLLVSVQPTGGTTGRSKGSRHTYRGFEAFILTNLAVTSYGDEPPVYLAAAPMTHAGGYICFTILARSGRIVVQPRVDPERFLAAIPKYRVSALFLPPTVIYLLLARPDVREVDYSSLRHFIYGAAPMSSEKLLEAIEVFGPVMTQVFGQTECLFPVTYMSPADHARAVATNNRKPLASCGRPAPSCRLAIMDEAGMLLAVGETGEIVVQTPMMMAGYHNDPALTAETVVDGWLHTGDIGYRDADNFYYIVDRKKDMIITGGFNVFSAEVEQAIMTHPAVQECVVVGIPHPKWGEEVKAVAVLRPGADAGQDEIIDLAKEAVGSIKAPKSVDFVDALPRSNTGKILKRIVREKYWSDTDRQVN